jgi:hypothetical protein
MEKQTYNGWTNYETWRVNLEMLDGINPSDYWVMDSDDIADTLPEALEEFVLTVLEDQSNGNSLVFDYARCFLSDVNWHEISEHMIADYVSEHQMETQS